MNLRRANQRNYGMIMLEVVVIIFSLLILVLLLLPALGAAANKRDKIGCTNNLKQMGLAFQIWEGDNNDKYPIDISISVTNGGAMELAAAGNTETCFQTMSNLSSPKTLVCPADPTCFPASSLTALSASNISYFINPSASEANPQSILSGDDNLEIRGIRVKSGLLEISSNTPIAWTADRHRFCGNVGMADGSAQVVNNGMLKNCFNSTNNVPLRLAIP